MNDRNGRHTQKLQHIEANRAICWALYSYIHKPTSTVLYIVNSTMRQSTEGDITFEEKRQVSSIIFSCLKDFFFKS